MFCRNGHPWSENLVIKKNGHRVCRQCRKDGCRKAYQKKDIPLIKSGVVCACGCGEETYLANEHRPSRGVFKGQPRRFINGHQSRSKLTEAERFFQKVKREEGDRCWMWLASFQGDGYGYFYRRHGGTTYAHIVSWEFVHGPKPSGMDLDHLCRNIKCVNPAHLELVTHRENVLRGVGIAAQRIKQTHCIRGHELDGELGNRHCKSCHAVRSHTHYLRKKKEIATCQSQSDSQLAR